MNSDRVLGALVVGLLVAAAIAIVSTFPTRAREESYCSEFAASVNHDWKLGPLAGYGYQCLVRCDDEWIPAERYVGCGFRMRGAK